MSQISYFSSLNLSLTGSALPSDLLAGPLGDVWDPKTSHCDVTVDFAAAAFILPTLLNSSRSLL